MNPFFNPNNFPFEVHGFYEDLMDAQTHKYLGRRFMEQPTRPLGSPGELEYELTEPVELTKGFHLVTIKASPQKPVRVTGTLNAVCGKVKAK